MRLLHRDHVTETIHLTEDLHSGIPPYAILSHRWGPDEVTLQELCDGTGLSKYGYRKIRFCGEQAWRDGLSHFWVDTCCIDKKNAVELQTAIISMFRWYHNATRCYVYLDDVSCPTVQRTESPEAPPKKKRKHIDDMDSGFPAESLWHSAFRRSIWFARGWTLQELLAPTSVEFFSREHTLLGNKSTLERIICDITRIPVEALRNCPLSEFSVSDRFTWMDDRETKLDEDKAYAMLGIFSIEMPLLYGEGYVKASRRLRREVSQANKLPPIPVAEGAAFDSRAEEHNARCYPDTRVDLLRQISSWTEDTDAQAIFWLNGIAGTGKSTISRSIAQKLHELGLLGASFFFKRGEADRGHAGRLFTTLAAQLAAKSPRVAQQIQTVIETDPDICNKALSQQFKTLILHTLTNIHVQQTLVIVIDALDECDKDGDIRAIIHLLSQVKAIPSVRLRTFLTSRPELPIRLGFRKVHGGYQDLVLHQMPQQIVTHDLRVFFDLELTRIHEEYNDSSFEDAQLPSDWPGQHVDALVRKAYPLFIVAATICRFLDPTRSNPDDQLRKLLNSQTIGQASDQLASTYLPVLDQLIFDQPDVTKQHILETFRDIVGTIILLARPVSARTLSQILQISLPDIQNQLKLLHSVLAIPSTSDDPIRIFHLSFRDFLLDRSRQNTHEFWINEQFSHKNLAARCIQLLSADNILKKDICGVGNPGVLLSQVDRATINGRLPPEVRYACLYWVHHLELGELCIQDEGQVHAFLQTHFLHWIEALCLLGSIDNSIIMVQSLRERCQPGTLIENFLRDAIRFIENYIAVISLHPLQLYCSAICFAPQKSVIREVFQKEMSGWIEKAPATADTWNACKQTLEGHSHPALSIAISADGRWLASGAQDGIIKIWNVVAGTCVQTLKSNGDSVTLIAISADGRWLASGGYYHSSIKIWDMITGTSTRELKIDGQPHESLAMSSDGSWLALGSRDGILQIWDVASGTCTHTLSDTGCSSRDRIGIMPESRRLVSGLIRGTIKIWDIETGACEKTIEAYSHPHHDIWRVAISGGRWLACIFVNTNGKSTPYTIKIWDAITGTCTQTLKGPSSPIQSIAISPDGDWLALGLNDSTVKIWDTTIDACEEPLGDSIRELALAPNCRWCVLRQVRYHTYQIWDLATGTCSQKPDGQHDLFAVSSDSRWLALLKHTGGDCVVRMWDTTSGTYKWTTRDDSWSPHSMVISPSNRWLALASYNTIKIWDILTGACIQTLISHGPSTCSRFEYGHGLEYTYYGRFYFDWSIAISPDDRWLASASMDEDILIWDMEANAYKRTLTGPFDSIVMSRDSRWLASASSSGISVWNLASGALIRSFYGHSEKIRSLSISPNNNWLASGSNDKTIMIWDVNTGTCKQRLEIETSLCIASVVFDSDTGLRTDLGVIELDLAANQNTRLSQESSGPLCTVPGSVPQYRGYGIDPSLKWVTWNGQKVMWLPPGYRPLEYRPIEQRFYQQLELATTGTSIAMICASRRLLVFKFSDDGPTV
ncbi:vegetative incompatibility protein HET-E-1 [Nemania sp. FL0916]|nr:vegetative incompatibility protein HET-E-1 [Nemania sp. FL0916]